MNYIIYISCLSSTTKTGRFVLLIIFLNYIIKLYYPDYFIFDIDLNSTESVRMIPNVKRIAKFWTNQSTSSENGNNIV